MPRESTHAAIEVRERLAGSGVGEVVGRHGSACTEFDPCWWW